MATFTTRLNATKPASSENVNITVLNDNADLFDAAVGATVGTSASRPASAFSGRLYYATDSAKLFVNSASSASAAASWQDSVANALTGAVSIGGDVGASGAYNASRSSSASNAYTATVHADAQKRYAVTAGGVVNWGSGASAADTNLYRSAADTLRTDDSLVAGGGITAVGTVTASTNLNVGGAATITGGLTVGGKGSVVYVRKATSESVISTTTVQDDDHITFSLAASAVYHLRAYLAVSGPAAGDFKSSWNITGAASGGNHSTRYVVGPSTGTADSANDNMRSTRSAWGTNVATGVDGSAVSHIEEGGILDTNTGGSGTITLRWAQNSSVATSTVVNSDSYAILQRLA